MTIGQSVMVSGLNFHFFRIMLAAGLLRSIVRGERIDGKFNKIDKSVIALGIWMMTASLFHEAEEGSGPTYTSGVVYNIWLSYYLFRIWAKTTEDVQRIVKILAVICTPIALEMIIEIITKRNMFSVFGYVSEAVMIRNGSPRASAAFPHPILAGTVGALILIFLFSIRKSSRSVFALGLISAIAIIITSASTGPIMTAAAGLFALALWKYRYYTRHLRYGFVALYIFLEIVMSRPAYFTISLIDLTGGSTGYHRAELIRSTIAHIGEWWRYGTDYTRHWMASGVSYSPNHTDITNYYISFAVNSGLLGILLFIFIIILCFKSIGNSINAISDTDPDSAYVFWIIGSIMFAHAVTSLSIAYFGQCSVLYWMTVALCSAAPPTTESSERIIET